MTRPRTIEVGYLTRVEGEGAVHVRIRDGEVERVELRIFEPPRLFESLLRGRPYAEAPDITARICGICPVAYQMSSVHALEAALGLEIPETIRRLRRLLYCGEWIESHALHVFMLHAPDFLGYPDAIRMAKDHGDLVRHGLRIKKAGNAILRCLGGREIHPINVRVGGFHRAPTSTELRALVPELTWARQAACEAATWTAGLSFPDIDRPYEFVALRGRTEYPFCEGDLSSSDGLRCASDDFEQHFVEEQVPYSTALHSRRDGSTPYLVGPLARFALNREHLRPLAAQIATDAGLGEDCRNPFQSISVRLVEIVQACDEALEVIDSYEPPSEASVTAPPRAATGCAITEAPRGILFHRYRLDEDGTIAEARIVPPTSQNQKTIENDVAAVVREYVDEPDDALRERLERAVRNHDPCISCATHFLKLEVDRE